MFINISRVHGELGSGNFGCVVKCTYNETGIDKQRDVAAKTLKESSETIEKIKFLQEAAIMGQFNHRNVVKLFGVIVSGTPVSFEPKNITIVYLFFCS